MEGCDTSPSFPGRDTTGTWPSTTAVHMAPQDLQIALFELTGYLPVLRHRRAYYELHRFEPFWPSTFSNYLVPILMSLMPRRGQERGANYSQLHLNKCHLVLPYLI
jgi:hypothetical protein